MNRSTALRAIGAGAAAALAGPAHGSAETLIPLRVGVIGSSGQTEVPYTIQTFGLDKKYGFALQIFDFAVPGQQYTMLRGDAIDMASGNFIDLLRQRKAGLAFKAFHGFQGYSNVIVTKPQSPIKTFPDLQGKRVGEFGTTFLDWLIVRAAGKRAYDVDLAKDATLVQGAPPLLNQLLSRDQVDATLNFSSLTMAPIAQGTQRAVSVMPDLMKAAGFNPSCFYLNWHIADKWVAAHPGALVRLDAMLEEAYAKMRTEERVWPELARRINITDPALITAYRDEARQIDDPPYTPVLIGATQKLLDSIIAVTGPDAVGVTQVDPAAFLFPGHGRR